MRQPMSLRDAVAEFVRDGDTVALEGTSHLVPFAAAHELIRQGRKDLTVVRLAPDLLLDQLVGMGCASRLVFGWGGSPGFARLHRLRDALREGWPLTPAAEQLRPTDLAAAYEAGAMNLPFGVLCGYGRAAAVPRTSRIRPLRCPFTGDELAVVRALRPDVAFIHAQEADRSGNVLFWGDLGVQKAAALASRRTIVTVEEIVDDLCAWPNAYQLPGTAVTAVCVVPGGAHPSPVLGYYERDRGFYRAWNGIARQRDMFRAWMARHVLATADFDGFRRVLDSSRSRSEA
jgi:glutaconate CoA-transferase, subunit A